MNDSFLIMNGSIPATFNESQVITCVNGTCRIEGAVSVVAYVPGINVIILLAMVSLFVIVVLLLAIYFKMRGKGGGIT